MLLPLLVEIYFSFSVVFVCFFFLGYYGELLFYAPELGRRSESVEWEMRAKIKLAPE
jgi:hypothetical protein